MTANGLTARNPWDYEGATHFALAPCNWWDGRMDGPVIGPVRDGS